MRQLAAALLLVLATLAHATSPVLDFGGCEYGGSAAGEDGTPSATMCLAGSVCCDATSLRTGSYGLHIGPISAATSLTRTFTTSNKVYVRFYFFAASGNVPSAEPVFTIGRAATQDYEVRVFDFLGGALFALYRSTTLVANFTDTATYSAWHRVEFWIDTSTNTDTYALMLDGADEGSGSTGLNLTTGLGQYWIGRATNRNSSNTEYFLDDWILKTDDWAGYGQTIVRQGTDGAPTNNAFTKAACTCQPANGSCQSCTNTTACCEFSQTPVNSTFNATSTGANAQTVKIAPFSSAETNPTSHGTEKIALTDTVNACKVTYDSQKTAGGSVTVAIRKIFNGTSADEGGIAITGTATNQANNDCCWSRQAASCTADIDCGHISGSCSGGKCTGSNSDLDTMEAGVNITTNNRTFQMNDVWVACDYQPQRIGVTGTQVYSAD